MPTYRRKPILTVTVEPETRARVTALVDQIPGMTLSGLVDELLNAGLPVYEQMAEAMLRSKNADGSLDEKRAEDAFHRWLGASMTGGLHNNPGDNAGKEDDE